jgi:amidase
MQRALCLASAFGYAYAFGFAFVIASPAWSANMNPEPSIPELQAKMATGQLTAETLVQHYLERINALNSQGPTLHAIISINPDALAQAHALDQERRQHGARGPLHGIPVLLKDNIESADRMPTTAGSLALADNFAVQDSPVAAALRAAGAIILGKTNLSEWANFRSDHASSGWSAVGGLTRNPYVLDRTPCGSSSGSAVGVAAGMAPASIGSETDGSITCPASMTGIVGLKPTLGLLSQRGIVPIAHSQDTAGPMAHTVADVATLLTALVSHGARDCQAAKSPPANSPPASSPCVATDYAAGLDPEALRGKRVGVLRFKAGSHPEMVEVYERALRHLRLAGATLVEVQSPDTSALEAAELKVLLSEFKAGINAYLAGTPAAVKTRDLAQLIEFNRRSLYELELFGQDIFLKAQATAGLDDADYRSALEESKRLAGAAGLDALLQQQHLDLLVAPTTSAAWRVDLVYGDRNGDSYTTLAAVAGYPHLSVPMGQVQELPVGLSFIGPAWSEQLLLACGYAFSQRSGALPAPQYLPTLETAAAAAATATASPGGPRVP